MAHFGLGSLTAGQFLSPLSLSTAEREDLSPVKAPRRSTHSSTRPESIGVPASQALFLKAIPPGRRPCRHRPPQPTFAGRPNPLVAISAQVDAFALCSAREL